MFTCKHMYAVWAWPQTGMYSYIKLMAFYKIVFRGKTRDTGLFTCKHMYAVWAWLQTGMYSYIKLRAFYKITFTCPLYSELLLESVIII